jgi:peroxiredoxin
MKLPHRLCPNPPRSANADTIAAKELAGGVALARLIAGSGSAAGYPAPDFSLANLDGDDVTLGAMRGKIVLLDFWATWCSACRSELPALQQLYRDLRANPDFAVLTVNLDEGGRSGVAEFMADNSYDFPVLLDPSNATSAAYGISGIPSIFVIGRNGRIIWNCAGAVDWSNPTVRSALKKLL